MLVCPSQSSPSAWRLLAVVLFVPCSETVVHGDLKAGNVLLTTGGADPDGLWQKLTGSPRRLVAKVADFGLSTVLGPTDTHASLTARVSLGLASQMAGAYVLACHCSVQLAH